VTAADEAIAVVDRGRPRGILRELMSALGILTRIPVAGSGETAGASAFGLIGGVVGAAGALAVILLGSIAPPVAAILAIAVIVAITGALHLDGLADTADALVAPTEEAAERARADPRAGTAAVAAITLVLIADWSLIVSLVARLDPPGAAAALLIAAATSRAVVALAPATGSRGFRPGFGSWFAGRVTLSDGVLAVTTAVAITGILAVVTGRPGLAVAGVSGVVEGLLWILALRHVRHGLDGDALGAVVELTLTSTLLAAVLVA
jgi:adenosylcobinamide-GDP ribazoletransferase